MPGTIRPASTISSTTRKTYFHYYNFSARADWQIRDNWKAFGRVSRIKTDQDSIDFTEGHDPLKLRNVQGSKRNGWNIAADSVYTFTPKTTINLRGAFYKVEDKRDYPDMNIGDYSSFWSDGWWKPYMEGRPLVYAPYLVVDTTARGLFGVQNFWYQEPKGYSAHVRVDHYFTKHFVKAGGEMRWKRGQAARFRFFTGTFISRETANTFSSPNSKTGSPLGQFPARRHGSQQFPGAIHSDAEGQYGNVCLLRSGRLEDQQPADRQSGASL